MVENKNVGQNHMNIKSETNLRWRITKAALTMLDIYCRRNMQKCDRISTRDRFLLFRKFQNQFPVVPAHLLHSTAPA